MPPKSRGGPSPLVGQLSKSSPNLPTIKTFTEFPALYPKTSDSTDQSPVATTPSEPPSTDASHASDEHLTSHDSVASISDDDEDEDEDDEALTESLTRTTSLPPAKRPLYNHTSRSYSHLPPSSSQLFPPFYNRPPTPLPPSPSLTSLLRPSFSRPTTPDTSDAESIGSKNAPPGSTPALAVAQSALKAPRTIPPVAPKIPTYEYYGFALYLASTVAFGMYLLWAYLPRPFLHQLGIYYYPNRWWALAIPAWLVVLVGYIFVALASWNTGVLTPPMGALGAFVDEVAHVAVVDSEGRIVRKGPRAGKRARGGRRRAEEGAALLPANLLGRDVEWRALWSEGTDAVMDVPVGGVCEILYGMGRERGGGGEVVSGEEEEDEGLVLRRG